GPSSSPTASCQPPRAVMSVGSDSIQTTRQSSPSPPTMARFIALSGVCTDITIGRGMWTSPSGASASVTSLGEDSAKPDHCRSGLLYLCTRKCTIVRRGTPFTLFLEHLSWITMQMSKNQDVSRAIKQQNGCTH